MAERWDISGVDDSCAVRFSDAIIMADSAMANGGADMWALNDSVIALCEYCRW
jgi:hypothetical protein